MIITEEMIKNFNKGLPKRLTIDGKTDEYETYLVPIKYLFYNNLNGRIATYIEEYNDLHPEGELNLETLFNTDIDKYNDLISDFIKKSSNDNEVSFKNTKRDIKAKGQQVPGVILTDGRIIDGNRRFTAIRELSLEEGDPRFDYFETVILPAPDVSDKDGWKRIKSLELYLQFNVDEKKGYNRIDFLVSFYKDTVNPETKMFDKKQYCYASGISAGEYEKNVNIIRIMLDYLEWRNKPKAFYILKNEKLDGPIEDIAAKAKKMSEEEWNSIKDYIYLHMSHVQSGDRTRDIRDLIKSAKENSGFFKSYKEEVDKSGKLPELIKAVVIKDQKATSSEDTKTKLETAKAAEECLVKAYDEAKYQDRVTSATNEPIKLFIDAVSKISGIDLAVVANMSSEKKDLIKEKIIDLEIVIEELKDAVK